MVNKSTGRKTYRTANGKSIDLDLLIQRNELTPAVGNARVNARGDELGKGGKIVRKREEVLRDYYQNSKSVPDEPKREKTEKKSETPDPKKTSTTPKADAAPKTSVKAQTQPKPKSASSITPKEEKMIKEFDEGWEEDSDGNLVKKGDK